MKTLSVLDLFSKLAAAGTPVEFQNALAEHIEKAFDADPLPRSGKGAFRVVRLDDVELPSKQGESSESGPIVVWHDLSLAEAEKRLSMSGNFSLLVALIDPEGGNFATDFAAATREDCDIYIVGESSNPDIQKIIEDRLGYATMMGSLGIQITGLRFT
ncbi:hypothetical protein [Dyella nitratireducens]|uniref:Uncharacterized protein n=1 Tax=Dyella nitratireducens TaxID=1849580 RepID=A0ABQ1GCW3_9GAMM|nr:hypothetical protein [Dyella nitratireducens]GGA41043.1 hypothetical protein GCM10010981_32800 [Dyella nitratireducens]GLQ40638.1 hypothetical protein GCM10007902_04870 [Dyella nitratireducens]